MDAQATTDHRPVFDQHMARHLDAVRHHDAIAQLTVVAEMAVGHQQIVITDSGLFALIGGSVDRDALADGVVISDHHLRGRTFVFQILGFLSQAGTWIDLVVLSDDQTPIKNGIGANPGVSTNLHIGPHHGAGTDHHASRKLGARIDHSEGVHLGGPVLGSHNSGTLFAHHRQSTSENINSPEHTSWPSTVASAFTLPKRLRLRLSNSQLMRS